MIHIIGKDILKFHSVYWPGLLELLNEKKESLLESKEAFMKGIF